MGYQITRNFILPIYQGIEQATWFLQSLERAGRESESERLKHTQQAPPLEQMRAYLDDYWPRTQKVVPVEFNTNLLVEGCREEHSIMTRRCEDDKLGLVVYDFASTIAEDDGHIAHTVMPHIRRNNETLYKHTQIKTYKEDML